MRPLNGNIDSGLNIGVTNKTAGTTGKTMLRTYANPTAGRASLGRVARINEDQRHPNFFGFVGYELPELKEGPTSHETAQTLTLAVCALTDAFQVLHADEAIGFLGKPDYALADVVIQVLLESAFSASQPFQDSLRAFCASPLQRCLSAGKLLPLFVDLPPRKHEACRSCCDAVYSEIDAQRVLAGSRRGVGLDAEVRIKAVPTTVIADSPRADLEAFQEFTLVFSQGQLEFCSAENRGNAGLSRVFNIPKCMDIYRKACWLKYGCFCLRCYAVEYSTTMGRVESIYLPNIVVIISGERPSVKKFQPVAVDSYFTTGRSKPDHGFRHSKSLIVGKDQFAFDGLNHPYIIANNRRIKVRKCPADPRFEHVLVPSKFGNGKVWKIRRK